MKKVLGIYGNRIAAHGPFVMNSREQIEEAYRDFRDGRFGRILPQEPAAASPMH
ncbi:MAG: hypothetical protein IT509_02035 [Rhodocyclaceae bacterium]|nr:hypothetical protein [Rhodocyclaceae bacterium]